jgi:DNA-binding transcriptional ArsR family regulator
MLTNRRCRHEREVSIVSISIGSPVSQALLAIYLIAALSLGPVAAAQATPASSATVDDQSGVEYDLGDDDDGLLNETDDTTNTTDNTTDAVDETTDTVDDTVDNTTDTVDGTVNETTDTVENTTDETADTVDETVDNTTDTVDGAVNETTDTVENTTDETTDTVDDTVENTTDNIDTVTGETVDSTTDLLDAADSWIGAELSVGVEDGTEPDDDQIDSQESVEAATGADERERDASAAGGSSGDEDGPTVPAPAAIGAGAVVIGAAGVTALTAGGSGVASSGGVGRSAVLGARSTKTGVKGLLSGLGDKLWRIGAVLRYSRWDDSDPLEHDTRREIYETVEDAPGIYLSKIDEQTDRSLSSLRHHLRILEEEGLLTTEKVRGKRRYFPVERGADDPSLVAALDDPATEAILTSLAESGPASGGDLADELDRDPSTVSHHLSRLEEEGLVERERDGRAVVNRLHGAAATALGDAPAASAETSAPADD